MTNNQKNITILFMENTIQSDLIRGHINTIILKALFDGDRYGYDIVREIEQKSSGQYKLKQPTLYSCLKRLEIQGFIRSYWGAKSNGGRRKYFTLTDMGRELFIKNQHEWEYSRTVIDKLISDKEYDFGEASAAISESDSEPFEEEIEQTEEADDVFEQEAEEQDEQQVEQAEQETEPEQAEQNENERETEAEQEKPQIVFSDTTAIMNELFRRREQAENDVSYAEKLIAEKYVSNRTDSGVSSDSYFKDFFDEREFSSLIKPAEPEQEPAKPSIFDELARLTSAEPQVEPQVQPEPEPEPVANTNIFLDYHSQSVVSHNHTSVIEREYRNILGEFLNPSFVERPRLAPEQPPEPQSEPEISEEEELEQGVTDESVAEENYEEEYAQEEETQYFTSDADVNRKLTRLTGEVREMGDNVKIRTHNNASAKEYSNAYYYYSNKLMIVHYGVLFAVMMLEILFSAVFVSLVMQQGRSSDKWFYIIAGAVAVAFPITAFVKNFTEPNKRKRINFSLKNSLIYRLIVMAQCFLIIYCVNIIAGMPLGFGSEYLATVLLPALLCTNFPVSALVFNSLYKTKKFSVEE